MIMDEIPPGALELAPPVDLFDSPAGLLVMITDNLLELIEDDQDQIL
jgi:hypothetical protein